jgi:diguanylate cyclase (GGDEF)-like protein
MEVNPFINELTGLPNYHLLLDRLNMSIAYSRRYQLSMAVCYLRIKQPKKISEYSSYEITQKFIKRMNNSMRDIDTMAKVNLTDYVILLTDINESTCQEIVKRLISTISNTYADEINLSVNIGVCIYPTSSDLQDELLALAKTQLFEAIEKGENEYSIYTGKLDAKAYRKVLIERDLLYAIRNSQLYLNYQPQIFLKELKIKGVEALVRWKHPLLGEILPIEFIPLAESTGFISKIFFWSLEEILKDIHRFQGDVKVSINISVKELLEENFKNRFLSYTEKYGIKPALITLEITENHKINDIDLLSDIIIDLKSHGVTIALDDFGSGYFSFLDFIKLPVDIIKLDKQFVLSESHSDDPLNQSIKNIVEMAHHLSCKVVIEGIETRDQYLKWKELNCDIIQGYYISKPLSLERLTKDSKLILDKIEQDMNEE